MRAADLCSSARCSSACGQAVIASYNFLGQLRDNEKELSFQLIIMDEAHYIKNKKVCGPSISLCPCLGEGRHLRRRAPTCYI